jgi:hypothetical protein
MPEHRPLKVFRMNDYEWWMHYSLEEAKALHLEQCGVDPKEAFDDPCELSA